MKKEKRAKGTSGRRRKRKVLPNKMKYSRGMTSEEKAWRLAQRQAEMRLTWRRTCCDSNRTLHHGLGCPQADGRMNRIARRRDEKFLKACGIQGSVNPYGISPEELAWRQRQTHVTGSAFKDHE